MRLIVPQQSQKRAIRRLLIIFAVLQLPAFAIADERLQDDRPRFALLIGVSRYAHLPASEQLEGCGNDVAAMSELLTSRFGFEESQIVTLVDQKATGDAIRKQMATLVQKVNMAIEKDQQPLVVFHFSGHGSQILDQPSGHSEADESDGLDETLVPHDAVSQGSDADIRDDELYRFVDQVCADDATRLWMVLDCCHSGTGARGATRIRKLNRGDLRIPDEVENRKVVSKRLPSGAVFLSACRANEVEPEYQDEGKTYGLLTRFLVEVLNTQPTVSKLSYAGLRDSIVARYRQDRTVMQSPVPTLEFGDPTILDESVISGVGIDRPFIPQVRPLPTDSRKVRVMAGSLQGITAGSLFALFPSPDVAIEAESRSATELEAEVQVRIESVEGASSVGTLHRIINGELVSERWPAELKSGYALERIHQPNATTIRVRVARREKDGKETVIPESSDATPKWLRSTLGIQPDSTGKRIAVATWSAANEPCDLLLRIDGHYAAIFPATGVPSADPLQLVTRGDVPRSLAGGWGPIDLRDEAKASTELSRYLKKIARARNLLSIVHRQQAESATTGGIPLKVELVAVDDVNDDYEVTRSHVWTPEVSDDPASAALVMHDGDRFTFRVTNEDTSGKDAYVTLLHIDSNMGIDQVHPWQPEIGAAPEGQQKLKAGESLLIEGYFECNTAEDEDPIYGLRQVVALGTREPNRFYLLAQGGLPVTRNSVSPLESLLEEEVEFRTRGGFSRRRKPVDSFDSSWGAAVLQWQVRPGR